MPRMAQYCCWLILFRLAWGNEALRADDWPQWRGPARTGHAPPGVSVAAALAAEPKIVWRIDVGEGFASPIVAAGQVFHFDNRARKATLPVWQADDGREIWQAPVDDTFQDEQGPPGPRCTPLVDGDC